MAPDFLFLIFKSPPAGLAKRPRLILCVCVCGFVVVLVFGFFGFGFLFEDGRTELPASGALSFRHPRGDAVPQPGLAPTGSRAARGEKTRRSPGPARRWARQPAASPSSFAPSLRSPTEKKQPMGEMLVSLRFRGRLELRLGVLACLKSGFRAKGDVSVLASCGQICMLCCSVPALPYIWLRNIQSVRWLQFVAPSAGNIQSGFLSASDDFSSIEAFRAAKRQQTGKGKGARFMSVTAGRNPPRKHLSASARPLGRCRQTRGPERRGMLRGCRGGSLHARGPSVARGNRGGGGKQRQAAGSGGRQRRAGERGEGGQPSRGRYGDPRYTAARCLPAPGRERGETKWKGPSVISPGFWQDWELVRGRCGLSQLLDSEANETFKSNHAV